MTRITKIYALLFFNLTVFLYGQLTHSEFEKESNYSIHNRETYRFDKLPDDGSYTISIADVYGNITLRGHNGSGAQLIILKTIHGLSEKKAKQCKGIVMHRTYVGQVEIEALLPWSSSNTIPTTPRDASLVVGMQFSRRDEFYNSGY